MPLVLLLAPAAFAAGAFLAWLAPDHIRDRSVRWRQALAVAAAAAGALAPGAATGIGAWDAFLRAGLSAGVVLLAARARPWPVFAGAAVLLAASTSGSLPLALAGAAAGAALATALTVRRRAPFLTSLIGLLASQAALRLPLVSFHGAASLAAAAGLAPLMVSGYRHLRPNHRRQVGLGLLMGAGATVVATVLALVGVALNAGSLQSGVKESRAGLAAGRKAQTEEASRSFSAAANGFVDARDGLEAPWVVPGRLVPVVGQHVAVLMAASRAGAELAVVAAQSAGVAEAESIEVNGGRLDLQRVRALEVPLEASRDAVRRALVVLDGADSTWVIGPLARPFERQRADLVRAGTEAQTALLAVRVLPGLLGGDGPRRYFLAVQQPAELRGSGGIIGNYGELSATDGSLVVEKFGRDTDLNQAAAKSMASLKGAPADYVARYGRFTPEQIWQNVTASPNFPSVARTIGVLYPQSGGQPVDGVISVTPRALAALLRITGPLEVAPWPEPITADNVESILQTEQYVRLSGPSRVAFLGDVAETVTRHLTAGTLPAPPKLARLLSPVVRSGDLLLNSFDPDEQSLFRRIGADGELVHDDDVETLALVTQNAGGNKVDAYLHRRLNYSIIDNGSSATATVTLRNEAPTSGVPDIVNFSLVGDPPGANRSYLSIHTDRPLRGASLEQAPLAMESEREGGLNVYSAFVVVPPNGTKSLEIRLGALQTGRVTKLRVHHQPTVIADELRVRSGTARFDGLLTADLVLRL